MSRLYDQYSAALFGVILRVVKSREVANDLLQDAFVKIWQRGASYDPAKGSYYTWMLNVARNTALDKVRSAPHRFRKKIHTLDNPVSAYDHMRDELRVDHIGLDNVIGQLEEKHRVVIDLIYFEGYTQKEVHEHLDIPLGTVKTRLRLALRELRKHLDLAVMALVALVSGALEWIMQI